MRLIGKLALLGCAAAIVLAMSFPLYAQGRHPAYIHALSDLRTARALLQRPDGGALHQQEKDACHELDKAIDEIKKAAADVGKDQDAHPPIDTSLDWRGRLHKALELIDKAHQDVSREEDDPQAQPAQQRALDHIDKARMHVKEAIAVIQ